MKMKWQRHLFIFSLATSASQVVTSTFINSGKGSTNAKSNNPQVHQQTVVVSTAADAAIALNSIAFMNSLCRRKNTADVRTFTQSITSSTDHTNNVHDHAVHKINHNNSCIEKQNASKDEDNSPSLWTLLNVFFRTDNEEQDCSEIMIPPSENNEHSSTLHNNPNTNNFPQSPTHETVAEYMGKLWFLPKNKGTIKFRETIRILSLGLHGETSTVECHTQYHNGSEWVDCSKVICHFSSSLTANSAEYDAARYSSSSSLLLLQQKVKMTLDCELLVWLPLPSLASKAVRAKIGSVFEEIVAEFFDELALT